MNKIILQIYLLSALIFSFSCSGNKSTEKTTENISTYYSLGKEVSAIAQGTLIQNLSKAIEAGGPSYAVEFCNLKAMELIDSISISNKCVVSRVTDLNRNPGNFISSEEDKSIWNYYKNEASEKAAHDTVVETPESIVYFKPIKIGMPTCLKCHGEPGVDIDQNTLSVIDSLYPKDLARNYKSGDLRGLWKIEFLNSVQ